MAKKFKNNCFRDWAVIGISNGTAEIYEDFATRATADNAVWDWRKQNKHHDTVYRVVPVTVGERICKWRRSKILFSSECGHTSTLFKFCPFCSGKVKVIK